MAVELARKKWVGHIKFETLGFSAVLPRGCSHDLQLIGASALRRHTMPERQQRMGTGSAVLTWQALHKHCGVALLR